MLEAEEIEALRTESELLQQTLRDLAQVRGRGDWWEHVSLRWVVLSPNEQWVHSIRKKHGPRRLQL